MSRLARPLAIALLAGTLVVAIGGIVHPMLEGTAADHLRLIAGTPHWRALHLAMLAGSALVVAGSGCGCSIARRARPRRAISPPRAPCSPRSPSA